MSRFIVVLLSAVSLFGCYHQVEGGPEVSKTRTLASFSRVRVETALTASLVPGSPQVTINAPQKVEENLETLVVNDTLVVRLKPGVSVTNLDSTEILLTGENVTKVEATQGGTLKVTGAAGSQYVAKVSGGAHLEVSGASPDFRVDASGGSSVSATGLRADYVSLSVSGGSIVDVSALKIVGGTVSGGSQVHVSGGGEFSSVYATEGSTIGVPSN